MIVLLQEHLVPQDVCFLGKFYLLLEFVESLPVGHAVCFDLVSYVAHFHLHGVRQGDDGLFEHLELVGLDIKFRFLLANSQSVR